VHGLVLPPASGYIFGCVVLADNKQLKQKVGVKIFARFLRFEIFLWVRFPLLEDCTRINCLAHPNNLKSYNTLFISKIVERKTLKYYTKYIY